MQGKNLKKKGVIVTEADLEARSVEAELGLVETIPEAKPEEVDTQEVQVVIDSDSDYSLSRTSSSNSASSKIIDGDIESVEPQTYNPASNSSRPSSSPTLSRTSSSNSASIIGSDSPRHSSSPMAVDLIEVGDQSPSKPQWDSSHQ